MFNIEEALKNLPDSPGVYLHKDRLGQVIYVGKAISLKNRVRSYFRSQKGMSVKVRALVSNIAEFEYILCDSEMEAFILECNLIKRYSPKYNVLLRDDKTYPYIKVTTDEEFPRIIKTRIVTNSGKYFGPYSDVASVNEIIDLLNKVFRLKRCSAATFPENHRPCLNFHIEGCKGVCMGTVDREEYKKDIDSAMEFLSGHSAGFKRMLKEKLEEASEKLEFEKAAAYRDCIRAIESISETQRVVLRNHDDMDILLVIGGKYMDGENSDGETDKFVVSFAVRDGKLSGRESYRMSADACDSNGEILASFMGQHYPALAEGPRTILVAEEVPDRQFLEEYLKELWGRKTEITVPQKGAKKALLDLAIRDAAKLAGSIEKREASRRETANALSREILNVIRISSPDTDISVLESKESYRIEAYDISNTNGVDSVGAMVVFDGGRPDRKSYRRFKIRTVEGPNDYGSMQEVIYRRFKRALDGDPAFAKMPDLLLIDGGKGHVAAVKQILSAMKLDIPCCGMAKDDSHRTKELVYERDDDFGTINIKGNNLLFRYVGTIQEEVHRFAIDYHKGLRNRNMLKSALEQIKGIGPAKRDSLLEHFGNLDSVKKASKDELMEADGITEKLADNIYSYFHSKNID